MAAIKQRKTKFSVIYTYVDADGNRKQKWDTLDTRKEAKARKKYVEFYQTKNGSVIVPPEPILESDADTDEIDPAKDITLQEFLKVFVSIYGVSTWSASTYASKVSMINNYIDPIIGDWRLQDISTVKLSKYYHDLLQVPEVARSNRPASGSCVRPANIKKIHDILRCALNQAIKWEYLDPSMRNPATLATLPKMKKEKRKVWSVETFRKAIETCDDDLLIMCMHLAFSCSLRVGEITALTWEDLVIDDAAISSGNARLTVNKELVRINYSAMQQLNDKDISFVFPTMRANCTTRLVIKTPKTETSNRTVWLPKTVAELLVQHRKEQDEMKAFLGKDYNDYDLVIAQDNGNPVENRIIRKRFQTLCEANQLEVVVFHSLRHLSTKYKLKMTGGDIKSVQGDTGHAEAEMVTDVYSEIVDEDRRHNAEKMEKSFYQSSAAEEADPQEKELLGLLKSLSGEDTQNLLSLLRTLRK